MTPERLAAFVSKAPLGAATLTMVHEQAIGGGITVASYTKEEVDQLLERSVSLADELASLARDHCDSTGEACRFLVQWLGPSGVRPLRTLVHKEVPTQKPADELGSHAMRADAVSLNAMVGQLLGHIHQQQKVLNGSIGAVFAAYERGMSMQQQTITELQKMLMRSQEQLEELAAGSDDDPIDSEMSALKRRGLEKIVEMAPHFVATMTQVAAAKLTGMRPANDNAQPFQRATPVANGGAVHQVDDDDDEAIDEGAQGTA